jgi:glycosyltransferase involved in cell wall biosynthesis
MTEFEIVICTHNRIDLLQKNIGITLSLIDKEPNFVLTIVNSNSKDGTYDYLNSLMFNNLRVIHLDQNGLSLARNKAISRSLADYLIFFDDDLFPDHAYFQRLNEIVNLFNPDIIGGIVLVDKDIEFPKWFDPTWVQRMKKIKSGFEHEITFSGGNLVCKRSVFDKVGYFNEELGMSGDRLILGEEKEFMKRFYSITGSKAYYSTELIVFEDYTPAKYKFWYRFRREIATEVNRQLLGKIIAKIFLIKFHIKVIKKIVQYKRTKVFTPLGFSNRAKYNFLILTRIYFNQFRK